MINVEAKTGQTQQAAFQTAQLSMWFLWAYIIASAFAAREATDESDLSLQWN